MQQHEISGFRVNVGISMMHLSISGGHKWRLRAVLELGFMLRAHNTAFSNSVGLGSNRKFAARGSNVSEADEADFGQNNSTTFPART
jgi:hypothetical protein